VDTIILTRNYQMLIRACLIIFSAALLLLQGCVAIQSFPTVARAGDTITLALGSAEGMTKNNTTVTYTPDSDPGNPIAIPSNNIRAIIPIYPDKRSKAWVESAASGIDNATGHSAWLTVMVLDLPDSNYISTGPGKIKIQTSAKYPDFSDHINDVEIAIDILPGTGISHDFEYRFNAVTQGNLSNLEVKPHYVIKPDYVPGSIFSSPWPQYAAIEITVTGAFSASDVAINNSMNIIMDDMDDNIRSQMNMTWSKTGNKTIINLTSLKGQLNYYNARASMFFISNDYTYTSPPVVTARYFDINGDIVAGPEIKATYIEN
jgi:hypothetical protein